ncbi:hypothetical protein KQH29_00845 [bacterium]|nr:hypothetical protein [bacterium]
MPARIRTIKPEFTRHEGLFDAEAESGFPLRLAYIGLWMVADREGRFKWRPRALKADVMPFDEVDFGTILEALASSGFLMRYEVDGEAFGCIPSWRKHQVINSREAASKIPAPPDNAGARTCMHGNFRGEMEGKGREGKGMRLANPNASGPAEPVPIDLPDGDQNKPVRGETDQGEPESRTPEFKTPEADPLEDLGALSDFYDPLTVMIQTEHPRAPIPAMFTKRWHQWRGELAKLATIDKYDPADIVSALRWVFEQEEATERWPGWRAQVQAIPALRKRKSADDLTKFAKIHAAWQKVDVAGASRPYRNADHRMTAEEVAAWDRI